MFYRGRGEQCVNDRWGLPDPALDVTGNRSPTVDDGVIDREEAIAEPVSKRIARGHITGTVGVIGFKVMNTLIIFRERQYAQEHATL